MKYAVAIDIGGTNTRVALIDEELNIISREVKAAFDRAGIEMTYNHLNVHMVDHRK